MHTNQPLEGISGLLTVKFPGKYTGLSHLWDDKIVKPVALWYSYTFFSITKVIRRYREGKRRFADLRGTFVFLRVTTYNEMPMISIKLLHSKQQTSL